MKSRRVERSAGEHEKVLTRATVLAADTVQLPVVVHLIVSADEKFSFRTQGLF